jgi:hypothetical protein
MAIIIPALPYTLTNGTTADANQVMADLNDIVSGVNANAAHNGPNSDITSLTGLTTPLTAAQGGTGVGAPGPAGNMLTSNGGIWQSAAPGPGLRGDPSTGLVGLAAILPPGGRLTLTSGVPVMTADVSAATTIYYTPYAGNNIFIYNGTAFVATVFPELSLTLNATPHVANTNYDLFVWNNAGTPQLVSGPAWSSPTARSLAIGLLQGVYTNSATLAGIASGNTPVTVPVNQGTYVGTFYTSAAGQTTMKMNPAAASGGSLPQLYLWNYYNRRRTRAKNIDNGAAYTYPASAVRGARNSASNAVNVVSGLAEDAVEALYNFRGGTVAAANAIVVHTILLDGVSQDPGNLFTMGSAAAYQLAGTMVTYFDKLIGLHSIAMGEASDGTNANNFDLSSNDCLYVTHWC